MVTFLGKDLELRIQGLMAADQEHVNLLKENRVYKGIALYAAATALLTLTATAVAPAAAAAPPGVGPPPLLNIKTATGSGCTLDTTGGWGEWDYRGFTVVYEDYKAQAGGDSRPADARRNCQLSLELVAGFVSYTYAVRRTTYSLDAELQRGAQAILKANYHFPGTPQGEMKTHRAMGPSSDEFRFIESVPTSELVWRPCGQRTELVINTELRVVNGTERDKVSSASMNYDYDAGGPRQTYELEVKPCP
ncbi:DUF4360 domain-containing protein [Actinomadura sp. KC06]|uniref:DUF4360 domain-containing protein n=1 Tax=Actinomadura sp. KC06 TaxID=2530369 RepID=UPI00104F6ADC|nr:DUF4360 domain-containing protein [Actinomadura sp. KC06]TDD37980.1 DUF4360 domain-containing protein [Actinomadura sp. KC06]